MLMHLHVNIFICECRLQILNMITMSMWIAHAFIRLVGVVALLHCILERLCHIRCHLGIIIHTLSSPHSVGSTTKMISLNDDDQEPIQEVFMKS